jgi:hypothetical protein
MPYGFQEARLQAFIDRHSVTMIHEVGLKCPCRDEDVFSTMTEDGLGAVARVDCSLCHGGQFIYRDAAEITGLLGGMTLQLLPSEMAWLAPGDAVFSASLSSTMGCDNERRIGEWDALTSTAPQPVDGGQVIARGAATRGVARGVSGVISDDEDPLWYLPGEPVWCEDTEGTRYEGGADYVLDSERPVVRWLTGARRPPPGRRYVIKYTAYVRWIVLAPPVRRWDKDWQELGDRVLIRKEHVFRTKRVQHDADAMVGR